MSELNEEIMVNKFTEESARNFRKQLISKATSNPDAPIIIYIDSYGGSIDSLNSMLDAIEQMTNIIITVCTGKAMSCGSALLAAGDHRFCGRNSRVLIHQGSGGATGPIEGLQNDVTESKRMNKELMTKIAKRCSLTLKELKFEMKKQLTNEDDEARDLYLTPEAALKIGIIDFIGMPHIKPIINYSVEIAPEKKYSIDKKPIKKKTKKKTVKRK